jgi:hypothetical protein
MRTGISWTVSTHYDCQYFLSSHHFGVTYRRSFILYCSIFFYPGDTYHAYNVQRTAAIRAVRPLYACSEHRGKIELYAIEKVAACATLDTVNNIDHMILVIAFGLFCFYGVRGGEECRELQVCNFLRQIKQEGYFKGELEILLNNLFDKTHQPSLCNSTCRSNDSFRRNAIAHRQFKNDFATTLDRYLDLCDPTQITLLCSPLSQKKLNEMRKESIENNTHMPTWRVDKTRPIGKHTLGNVMMKLSEMCAFDEPDGGGKQTNAAGRHLCITRC